MFKSDSKIFKPHEPITQAKAGHSHLNVTKRPARINRLGNTAYATEAQTHKLKKVLLPYGSN